jgi:hypothetical protein
MNDKPAATGTGAKPRIKFNNRKNKLMKIQIASTRPRQAFAPALARISSALNTVTQPASRLRPEGLGRQHSRLRRLLALVVFGVGAFAVAFPHLVSAQTIFGPSGPDIQVNDPSLDLIQYPPGASYPFENATESEATVAADGQNIVVSYNSTAGLQVSKVDGNQYGGTIHFSHNYSSAYSVTHDGGVTWRSGFIPPSAGSIATYGDGVVRKDRAGNFYYATLGQPDNTDVASKAIGTVIISKSTNHGDTFGTAVTVAVDNGSDKEWIAIGPDPVVSSRDNIYLTWTSFQPNYNSATSSVSAFSMSTDGGLTWTPARKLFAYTDDGVLGGYVGSGSSPTVDKSNGRLYVPFVHGGHRAGLSGHAYLRVLASDDAGSSFAPLAFNVPGAPDPFVYPAFQPTNMLGDCGAEGGLRVVVKHGPDIGGGILGEAFGVPRYVECSRVYLQPSAVAEHGRVVIALNASTADAPEQLQILALYSTNGGTNWFPSFIAAPATAADPQHFHPALALAHNGHTLYLAYYVQQSDDKVRTELATFQLTDSGLQLLSRKALSSVAFDLRPCNIPSPFPPLKSEDTVNFDQHPVYAAGYNLGEYMGVGVDDNGNPMAAWGDNRNTWVSPPNGLHPGPHGKSDVFFVRP